MGVDEQRALRSVRLVEAAVLRVVSGQSIIHLRVIPGRSWPSRGSSRRGTIGIRPPGTVFPIVRWVLACRVVGSDVVKGQRLR